MRYHVPMDLPPVHQHIWRYKYKIQRGTAIPNEGGEVTLKEYDIYYCELCLEETETKAKA